MQRIAGLEHPAIARCLGFGHGDDPDTVYAAFERKVGGELQELLGASDTPLRDILAIGCTLAEGLAAAHRAGVVHAGLRPQHVRLPGWTPGKPVHRHAGKARIEGLGLPTYYDRIAVSHRSLSAQDLLYRAPEQLSAGPTLGFPSDVYAWGLMLLHALTGRHPLLTGSRPSTTVEVIARQAGLDPERALRGSPAPRALGAILSRSLDVDVEMRYPNATHLLKDLAEAGIFDGDPGKLLGDREKPTVPSVQPANLGSVGVSSTSIPRVKAPSTSAVSIESEIDIEEFDDVSTLDVDMEEIDLDVEEIDLDALEALDEEFETVTAAEADELDRMLSEKDPDATEVIDIPQDQLRKILAARSEDLDALIAGDSDSGDDATPPVPVEARDETGRAVGRPTVDVDDAKLGDALDEIDSTSQTSDAAGERTPAFTYDENGEPDIPAAVEAQSPPSSAETPAVQADAPPSGDEAIPETEPESAPLETPLGDADLVEPIKPAGTSRAGTIIVALILLAGAGVAVYWFVVRGAGTETKNDTPERASSASQDEDVVEPPEDTTPPPPPPVCEAGDAQACFEEARTLSTGPWYERDEPTAVKYFEAVCEAGEAGACGALAEMVRAGRGVDERDPDRAFEVASKACEETSSPWACRETALMLADGIGTEGDPERAVSLLEAACQANDNLACLELARLLVDGKGVEEDRERAAQLVKNACEAGEGEACGELAEFYRIGVGVDASSASYREYHDKGCELKWGGSCKEIGDNFRRGEGRKRDRKKAARFFSKGCDYGYAEACSLLCYMEQVGQGIEENDELALIHCTYGCELGDPEGCYRAAVLMRQGVGDAPEEQARALFQQACDLGHEKACGRTD